MISIIIPTFNRAVLLKKAVESVLAQTYPDFELIIVDDGSTDNTKDLVLKLDRRIIYLRQDNKGPASARNLGIKTSKRPFLAFLDSDDRWDSEKLEEQLKAMQGGASSPVSHTQEVWYKEGRLLNQKKRHEKPQGYIFNKCLPLCVVSMSTVMVRREVFESIGLFDEDLPCCEDYDFWLRASIKYDFILIDKPLTLKDGGRRDQVSSLYATGMDKFRIASILKVIDSGALDPEQKRLAVEELRKKSRIYGNGCIKHGKEEEGREYLTLAQSYG